ncbi:hypothetical protein FRB90_005915 [Tulasnella sp. 427]|nr:hypothetical protein FRB90_005915 [Tulasnella sp. 427]
MSWRRISPERVKFADVGHSKAGATAEVLLATLLPNQLSTEDSPDCADRVAVKKLRLLCDDDFDHALAPFAHEISLLAKLQHRNIVNLLGFSEDFEKGIAWIILPWEANGNLREFVHSADWEIPERVSLIYDLLSGLEYLHNQQAPICHGDLKSLNVLVSFENRAVITDFGSARVIEDAGSESISVLDEEQNTKNPESPRVEFPDHGTTVTVTGPAWTLRWAAPELLNAKAPSLASDMWAFAWICWEVMTGNFPFYDVQSDGLVIVHLATGNMPTISDDRQLSQLRALCSLMSDCWSIDPQRRPAARTAREYIRIWTRRVIPTRRTEGNSDETQSAVLLAELGKLQLANENPDEAMQYYKRAIDISRSTKDDWNLAQFACYLAEVYEVQSNYAESEKWFTEAREAAVRCSARSLEGSALQSLGDMYRVKNDYPQAIRFYQEAREAYLDGHAYECAAHPILQLAMLYWRTGECDKAEELCKEALDIHTRYNNTRDVLHARLALGRIHLRRRHFDQAKSVLEEVRAAFKQGGDTQCEISASMQLGHVHRLQGLYAEAESIYTEAQQRLEKLGAKRFIGVMLLCLGEIREKQGRKEEANEYLRKAFVVFNKLGWDDGLPELDEAIKALYHRIKPVEVESHINHSLFWKNLSPIPSKGGKGGVLSDGPLKKAIEADFGSVDNLKNELNTQTAAIQGSGWGWLGYNKKTKRLEVATTPNQDPLISLTPLIGIDIWEHAFYLQYKNDKVTYLKEIWNVINFDEAQKRYVEASNKAQLPIGSSSQSTGLPKTGPTLDTRIFPVHYSSTTSSVTSHPSANLSDTELSISFPSSPSQPITLPYIWLRDSCPCPSCVHPSTRQKLHRTSDVPGDIKPKRLTWVHSLDKDAKWALEVEWDRPLWKHDTASTGVEGHRQQLGGEGHRSRYEEKWLKLWSDEQKVSERNHASILSMVPWLKEDLVREGGESKLFCEWEEIKKGDEALLGALRQLTNYGITIVRGVPITTEGQWELENVANTFSYVRETFYGPLWDVKSLRSARNVAYTDLDLDLHMDLLYFENPPRYQLLHCLRNRNVTGGQSIFVDAVQAAQTLWKEDREAFDILATTDVPFHYVNDGHHLTRRHKTIVLSPSQPSSASSPPEITAINYSPPFQAPLPPSTPPSFYQALQKFAGTLRRPEGRWEYLMKEGDVVVFDNRRVLHARRAFTENGAKGDGECNRWLKGCYVEADAVVDRLRVLRKRFPNADRTRLVLEIAEGLNYLHHFEPGIIHGDVKGNNVLISSDHHAQLCDFGLARHIDARTATALKGAGSVPWQSPEVLRDGIGKSFETDVYAFGITIYEVLSGNQPYFDHSGLGTIITGVLLTGLRPPMDPPASAEGKCYSRLWNEASRCWSEDPTERPAMAEVLQSLSEPVAGPSSIKSPPQPPRKSQTNDSSPIKAVVSQTPARINIPFTPKRKAEKFVDSSILRAPKRKRLSLDSQSKQVPSQLRLLPELESSFIAPDSPPTATRVAVAEPSLTEDPPQRETYRDSISSSEYSEEIYEYFKGIESSRTPVHRYMDVHPEQVWRARERVVDWLFLVHRDAKLRLETFWMSINLFDRLASIRQVSVKKFQFTVLVCSSLAAKYHEYNPPIIDYWVSGLAEEGYQTTAMFGKCELYLSKALDWRLECPNPLAFLKMISVADGSNIVTLRLAEYPVLIQCFDPHLLEYRPSLIAAAAYWLTKISQRDFDWPSFLSDYTGYSRRELFPPMTSIVRYLCGLTFLSRLGEKLLGGRESAERRD